MATDEYYMGRALTLAAMAEKQGEVPIGALIVLDNTIIAESHNAPITQHDPTAHAEIIALRQAGQKLQNYRLLNTTLYVTLEPCAMCATAILHARIARCVFASSDPKAGAAGSVINIFENYAWNHRIEYQGGVLQTQASELLKNFFAKRRFKG